MPLISSRWPGKSQPDTPLPQAAMVAEPRLRTDLTSRAAGHCDGPGMCNGISLDATLINAEQRPRDGGTRSTPYMDGGHGSHPRQRDPHDRLQACSFWTDRGTQAEEKSRWGIFDLKNESQK